MLGAEVGFVDLQGTPDWVLARDTGVPMVINARTDGFVRQEHGPQTLAEAIHRANAYREAGAEIIALPRVSGLHHRYEWREAA